MPRQVTLTFDQGDHLVTRRGSLVDSSATALTVRLDAAPPPGDDGEVPEAPEVPTDAPIVAVVHPPAGGTAAAFLMTTRLAGTPDPAVVRLARAGHAP